MLKYEFQPNKAHRFLNLTLERQRSTGEVTVSSIFSFNVKLDANRRLDSLHIRELTRDFKEKAAGTFSDAYELKGKLWMYPKFMRRADGAAPPTDFNLALNDVCRLLEYKYIIVNGAYDSGLAVIAQPNIVSISEPRIGVMFAAAPEITAEFK